MKSVSEARVRVDDARKYLRHVRAETFPKIRAGVSVVSAFAAVAVSSPTWKVLFSSVAALSAGGAVFGYYAPDPFGISGHRWKRMAKDNLRSAESALKVAQENQGTFAP